MVEPTKKVRQDGPGGIAASSSIPRPQPFSGKIYFLRARWFDGEVTEGGPVPGLRNAREFARDECFRLSVLHAGKLERIDVIEQSSGTVESQFWPGESGGVSISGVLRRS